VDANDLFRIATLGFRDEALPSITDVSEFTIASRPHAATQGYELRLNGGTPSGSGPCAMSFGICVTVRNLFWNVFARLKFLKSEAAESGHVTDQVMRLALSHPRVAFRLEIQSRAVVDQPVNETLEARVRALFGSTVADRLLSVHANADTMQIAGFVAHPQEAKPTTKRQFVFLNGRYVKDRLLLAAVREGFRGFLEPRLHGAVFLHLDLDPSQVDVNVHPTKSEVRFRREGEVFALVRSALQKALATNAGGFSLLPAANEATSHSAIPRSFVKPLPATTTIVVQERYIPQVSPAAEDDARKTQSGMPAEQTPEVARLADARAPSQVAGTGTARAPTNAPSAEPASKIRRVLQLNRMYLLIETAEGIRLVDQHALHEKALLVMLDPTVSSLTAHGRQELLVPITITLLAQELAQVAPVLPDLARVGIIAETLSPTQIVMRAHPVLLKRTNWPRFFADLAHDPVPAQATATLSERIAHSAACHAAVKAGQELTPDEQWELARLLERFDGLEHCPHGRPTSLDLGWDELARRFQR
ncbi:MAG TPA: DNA mismatch repair endonuclease MutL, partial [Planctomycetota bacterium]|nr:DNA mismatch repair endonuclease MutL [Planctomycetota bacterium]